MKHYKIIVAYGGTDYHGWQIQKDVPSITQTLQHTFFDVFKKPVSIIGASRTDAGVHALGQVALCTTNIDIDPHTLQWAWNNRLPAAITIRSLTIVDDTFHPQRNVAQKIYHYHFFLKRPLLLIHRYGWFYRYPVDQEKLRELLPLFVGTHNFRSFCTDNEMGDDTIRTIDAITLEEFKRFGVWRITVKGERFLHHMIRRIVGAALEGASHPHWSIADIRGILNACNPEHSLPSAPAQGLLLYKILYHNERA